MKRNCDVCGTIYEAKRSTSRFCGSGCRVRATRARAEGQELKRRSVSEIPTAPKSPDGDGLEAATRRELEAAGRLNTILGQTALVLARRLAGNGEGLDTGASLASISKELRAVMVEAMAGVAIADDPIDELRRRRELKLSG